MIKKEQREYSPYLYDLGTTVDDVEFYITQAKNVHNILELGCGTGRVLIPLAKKGIKITGLDYSDIMLARCSSKTKDGGLDNKVNLIKGDIRKFELGKTFDMIIAPGRVVQAIKKTEDFQSCLNCIKNHLSENGFCILNVFHPNLPKEEMKKSWPREQETFQWEKIDPKTGLRVMHFDERRELDAKNQVLYPVLIYRTYAGDKLVNEVKQNIIMKYYYPEEFEEIITKAGFKVLEKYGGYKGEEYRKGKELVIKFSKN